jgi:hypothetical protein
MNGLDVNTLVGGVVGLLLTLMIFSYLLGDNFLFRLAIHIFIGVAAGYVTVVAVSNVLLPRLVQPLLDPTTPVQTALLTLAPLALSLLLLGKLTNRFAGLGRPVMAFLVGVGAATVIGGAVLWTLTPQIQATINLFDRLAPSGFNPLAGLVILIGMTTTLTYFHFSNRSRPGALPRPTWLKVTGWIGQGFIAVTFGAVFAGVYAAALAALIERLDAILDWVSLFI